MSGMEAPCRPSLADGRRGDVARSDRVGDGELGTFIINSALAEAQCSL